MMSGYTSCACRDCMDTTVSSDTSKPELCSECTEAGCEAATVLVADLLVGTACKRDDAYGSNEPEHTCGPGIQWGCDVPDCDGSGD